MTKEEAISIISGYEAYGCGYCLQGDEEVEEALRLAVDALRQETVIRCKDCKYWLPHRQFGFDGDNEEYHDYCERLVPEDDYYAFTRNADDFCSRAKRKEE